MTCKHYRITLPNNQKWCGFCCQLWEADGTALDMRKVPMRSGCAMPTKKEAKEAKRRRGLNHV